MSVNDLLGRRGAGGDLKSGIDWLLEFKNHYSHIIWLHPQMRPNGHSYWTQSFDLIAQQFPMYQITLEELTLGNQETSCSKIKVANVSFCASPNSDIWFPAGISRI